MLEVVWFLCCLPIFGSWRVPDDLIIPYNDLNLLQNKYILSKFHQNETISRSSGVPLSTSHTAREYPDKVCLYQEYRGYKLKDMSKLITQEMIVRSFDVQGSFRRLQKNLQKKMETMETFNVLFIGGSVCVGHGCTLCQHSESFLEYVEISNECSWTHRFVRNLQYLVSTIHTHTKSHTFDTIVSPRYCCKSATSTNMGLDILITQSYHSSTCQLSNVHSHANHGSWEPDLILWDYSVNDLSSRWFRNRSRKDVYEGFVLKVLNITSQPQLIVLESLNRRLDLKSSDLRHLNESWSDRLMINSRYDIPMVNYLSAIGTYQAQPMTSYYAQAESNRHPGWPTHILWAQLMTEAVLRGLRSSSTAQLSSHNDVALSFHSTQYCLCIHGYTSYQDFENRPSVTNLTARQNVETAALEVNGNWSFRGDVAQDPYKTGWIYESDRSTMESNSVCERTFPSLNKIVFHCPNVSLGRVKIGYLASYGPVWGSVLVSISAVAISSQSGSRFHQQYPPLEINSRWSSDVSIRMEKEILLKDMFPDIPFPDFCSSNSSNLNCPSDILVDIQFCPNTGRKFKILSIACC